MRIRSKKMPLRVAIACASLAGLGAAAMLPMVTTEATRTGFDPIITSSISDVDPSDPSRIDMPAELTADQGAPRQILPQAPDTARVTMPHRTDDPILASSDPEVTVALKDETVRAADEMVEAMGDAPTTVETASLAGEASDPGGIVLALDHARVMRVVGDVATIIIGNPSIADVSMPDPGTMVLTGKSYGETNMVMLDANGDILAEQMLRVTVRGQSLVSVYRGVQRTTLSCSPTCEIRPTPGDTPDVVEAGLGAFQARNQAALEAVRGGE